MQNRKFKQTEIGEIPEDWDVKKLDEITQRVCVGYVGSCFKDFCDESSGVMLIRTGDLTETGIDYSHLKFVTKKFHEKNIKSQLKQGDLLIARHGENGRACIYNLEKAANCLNVVIVKPNQKKAASNFLLYAFKTDRVKNQIFSNVGGSVQGVINTKDIQNLSFPYPNGNEREMITKILSDLDSKIELNQQMNKTLESIGQALFKHWFIDFEFPNEEGKPYKSSGGEMVDSELGEIPLGWKTQVLPEIAKIVDCLHTKKPAKTEDGKLLLQFYNLGEFHGIDLTEPYQVSDKDYEEWTRNILVREGDILFTNAGKQALARVPYWFQGGIGRNITAVRAVSVNSNYLFDFVTSSYGENEISKNTDDGTIFSSLNVKGIKKLNILIPSDDVIKSYVVISHYLRYAIENNLVTNDKLKHIRDSLLPKLMSGKIRVQND